MNVLPIVFMGTPPFAVRSLDALHRAGSRIAAVVTAPDRPAGRGLQVRPSAVKERAAELGLPVLQPVRLNDPGFLDELRGLGPSLIVVVAFRKLPEQVFALPPLGTINLHASLLPDYRGAAPINWAVINGEVRTGVTTFFIAERIDTGDVIHQEVIDIGPDETAGEVHDRLAEVGAALVVRTVSGILDGTAPRTAQLSMPGPAIVHAAPKLNPDNCRIDWSASAQQVHDHIRGLSPHPGAWTSWVENGQPARHFKVLRSARTDEGPTGAAGTLWTVGNDMLVTCGDGVLQLLEVQAEGRKRMAVSDFLHGHAPKGAVVLV